MADTYIQLQMNMFRRLHSSRAEEVVIDYFRYQYVHIAPEELHLNSHIVVHNQELQRSGTLINGRYIYTVANEYVQKIALLWCGRSGN